MNSQQHNDDEWQRRATAAAIQAAKDLIGDPVKIKKSPVLGCSSVILSGTPIGRLDDTEWGWLLAAMVFAWISVRAQQAISEGREIEATVRTTRLDPEPWDAGVIAAILPQLASDTQFDWNKPLKNWSRVDMICFLQTAFDLVRKATTARDLGSGITRKRHHDDNHRDDGSGREHSKLSAGIMAAG
jgi:hypothetical protein